MKIVDEKGRLFGKVNLIDLLVLLLVIAAAGSDLEDRRQEGCRARRQAAARHIYGALRRNAEGDL